MNAQPRNEGRNRSRIQTAGLISSEKKLTDDIRTNSPLGAEVTTNIDTRLGKLEETPTNQNNQANSTYG
jgi:hypothetical protein